MNLFHLKLTAPQYALVRFLESLLITAVITAAVSVSQYLAQPGQIDWNLLLYDAALAFAFSLCNGVVAFIQSRNMPLGAALQGLAQGIEKRVQPVEPVVAIVPPVPTPTPPAVPAPLQQQPSAMVIQPFSLAPGTASQMPPVYVDLEDMNPVASPSSNTLVAATPLQGTAVSLSSASFQFQRHFGDTGLTPVVPPSPPVQGH